MMITVNIVRAPTIRLRPLSSTPYAGDALVLVLPHHVRWKTGPRQPGSPGCRLCACAGAQVSGGSGGGGGSGLRMHMAGFSADLGAPDCLAG